MSWAAVIVGGASLVGGALSSRSSGRAADAQVKGDQAAINEQRRQFDLIMQMLQPQINTGTQALNTLNRLYGFNESAVPTPGAAPNAFGTAQPTNDSFVSDLAARVFGRIPSPNTPAVTPSTPAAPTAPAVQQPTGLDVFFASPDYQFRRNEGMRGIENSFAARGGAASGNALRALNEFNSNLASSEFGNFFNRTAALAGIGQTATNQGVNAAQYTGGNVSNLLGRQGDARASGITGRGNALSGTINDLASIYGLWRGGAFGGN